MDERYIPSRLTVDMTSEERVRLVKVMEEAGELIQAAAKCLLWGYESRNPLQTGFSPTNQMALIGEFGDLSEAMKRLQFD